MSNKFSFGKIVLVAVLVAGLFLRIINVDRLAGFTYTDTGRDVLIAKHMTIEGRWNVAPLSSLSFIPNTPIYYWFLAVSYFLLKSVLGLYLIYALLGTCVIIIGYRIGKLYGKRLGLIVATLFSFNFSLIYYSRGVWQPNLIPFFVVVAILFCLRAEKRYRVSDTLISILFLFLGVWFHYSIVWIIPALLAINLVIIIKKSSNRNRDLLIFLTFIFILMGAWWRLILWSHPSFQFGAWGEYSISSTIFSRENIFPRINELLLTYKILYGYGYVPFVVFLLFSIKLLVDKKSLSSDWILATLWLSQLVVLLTPTKNIELHYMIAYLPITLILMSRLLIEKHKLYSIVGLIVLIFYVRNLFGLFSFVTGFEKTAQESYSMAKLILSSASQNDLKEYLQKTAILYPDVYFYQKNQDLQYIANESRSASVWYALEEIAHAGLVNIDASEDSRIGSRLHTNPSPKFIYLICPIEILTSCDQYASNMNKWWDYQRIGEMQPNTYLFKFRNK